LYRLYWGRCVCTGYTGDGVCVCIRFMWFSLCSSSDALDGGFEQASLADLCVVFGSSLTVTPAADMPLVWHVSCVLST